MLGCCIRYAENQELLSARESVLTQQADVIPPVGAAAAGGHRNSSRPESEAAHQGAGATGMYGGGGTVRWDSAVVQCSTVLLPPNRWREFSSSLMVLLLQAPAEKLLPLSVNPVS